MRGRGTIDARYRQRVAQIGKIAKWPAIGALIAGGAFAVGYFLGPPTMRRLGADAGEGFAQGMAKAQDQIASIQRQLSVSGWGSYR